MTVQIFVGRDFQNVIHEPQYAHEFTGIRAICTYLWQTFHQQEKAFAVIAAPQMTGLGRELSPDLFIISEEGMGVLELKQSSELIDCSEAGGKWTAGGAPIKAGKHLNPHKQVQSYMIQIREDLINSQAWLPGGKKAQRKFKFHTAVCFPNPRAEIEWCRTMLAEKYRPDRELESWEKFSVLKPEHVPEWAGGLRFEVDRGEANFFRTYRLTAAAITGLATYFFNSVEWELMTKLMPLGTAYAYLALEDKSLPPYRLARDHIVIGRDWSCEIVLPGQYKRASNKHAHITRNVEGVFIKDLGSTNGTFINGKPIKGGVKLYPGQTITLGGKTVANDKVCQLRYVTEAGESSETEVGTFVNQDVG